MCFLFLKKEHKSTKKKGACQYSRQTPFHKMMLFIQIRIRRISLRYCSRYLLPFAGFGEEIVVTLVADDADEQLRAVALGDAHRAGVGRYAPDRCAAERQRRKHQYEWENVALHGMSLRVSDCPGGPDRAYKGNSLILKKQTDRADRFAVSFRRMRAGGPDGSLGVPGASISPAAKVSCSA